MTVLRAGRARASLAALAVAWLPGMALPAKAPPGKPPATSSRAVRPAPAAPSATGVAVPAPASDPIADDPSVDAAMFRAAAARVAKRHEDALRELGQVEVRADAAPERRAEAAYQRGLVLEDLGRGAEAIRVWEQLLQDLPRGAPAPHARLSLARRLVREGRLDEAVEHYRALTGAPPELAAPALLEGGAVEDRRGRVHAALDAWRQVAASFPRAPEAADAKRSLADLCARVTGAPSTTHLADAFARATCHLESGRPRDAEREYEAALKRARDRDDRVELWMGLGRSLVAQDRHAAAESAFRQVVRAVPGTAAAADAQMEIVQGHLDRGRLPDAIRELERMAKAFPGTAQAAQALFTSGNCWEGLGNRKKAEAAYRRVLITAPASPWANEAQRALLRLLEEAR